MQQTIQEITPLVDPRSSFPYRTGDEWTGYLRFKPDSALYLAVLLRKDQSPKQRDYLVLIREQTGFDPRRKVLEEIDKKEPFTNLEARRIAYSCTPLYIPRIFPYPGTEQFHTKKIEQMLRLPLDLRHVLSRIHDKAVEPSQVDALLSRTINAYPDLYS